MRKLLPGTSGLLALGLLLIAVIFLACAAPPQEQMDAARAALARAENDPDAAAYAVDSIARVRDIISRMEAESAAKRYDSAKTLAAEAVSAAEKAVADGRAAALRARDEAAGLLDAARILLAETQSSLDNARGANLALDYDELGKGIASAQNEIDQAVVAFTNGRYTETRDKSSSARSALAGLQGRIAEGAQAVNRKK
ncbi:MAG: hypothetical protein LBT11_01555 [Treponema sp.]|jgi:hypothetical protein|nr:hypothetical protein [Treponema sp.]